MARRSSALSLVLDVSREMGARAAPSQAAPLAVRLGGSGGDGSCLDRGKELMDALLANVMREKKAKDLVHLATFGSDKTDNAEFEKYQGCEHVVSVLGPSVCDKDMFLAVDKDEAFSKVSSQSSADIGAAVRVAHSALRAATGTKKYDRRVVVFTNGRGVDVSVLKEALSDGDLEESIRTDVVLLDSADGPNEAAETLRALCESNKSRLRVLTFAEARKDVLDGHVGTHGEVAGKYLLQISPDVGFHVRRFTRSKPETAPSLKKASLVHLETDAALREKKSEGAVSRQIIYSQPDDADQVVAAEDLVDGYRFGRQAIPFSEADVALRTYEQEKQLYVVGFAALEEVPIFLSIGCSEVYQAAPLLERSRLGFSAFVRALLRRKQAALARFVWRAKSKVKMLALIPHVSADGSAEWLISRELPFEQDIRSFAFEPLSDADAPSAEQEEAAKALVESLYIGGAGAGIKVSDSAVAGAEQFVPERTLNPLLERVYRLLEARMKDPNCPLQADTEDIRRLYQPDPAVLAASKGPAARVAEVFELSRVPIKDGSKRKAQGDLWGQGEADTGAHDGKRPRNGGAEEAAGQQVGLVGGAAAGASAGGAKLGTDWFYESKLVESIGSVDPAKDYMAMSERKDKDMSGPAFRGLCEQIDLMVKPDGPATLHAKALACLQALRKGSIMFQTEEEFNEYLPKLKATAHAAFWEQVRTAELSLITSSESQVVETTPQQALAFLKEAEAAPAAPTLAPAPQVVVDEAFDDFE